VLSVAGRVIEHVGPLQFWYEAAGPADGRERPVGGLGQACRERRPLAGDGSDAARADVAPCLDFGRFRRWEEYLEDTAGWHGHANTFDRRERDARGLAREAGPVTFTFDDPDGAALEALLRWQIENQHARGVESVLARPRYGAFLRALQARGLLTVSTLRAGGQLVAARAGTAWEGRFYARASGFAPAFAARSPGAYLLHRLLEHLHGAGFHEFDTLLGNTPYKFFYATDVRVVGPIGRQPLRRRTWAWLRRHRRRAARAVA
jgi:CelD/BcsL family acetyltransferase involved in cellulose biosynthesis